MRFFSSELQLDSKSVMLSQEESNHCVRVLRSREGAQVEIVNGKGLFAIGTISKTDPKKCLITVNSCEYVDPTSEIHLGLAPTKQFERIEWFLEKAVELGLTKLTFIQCKNSERKKLRMDRLEKTAISAMKQSNRLYLPEIQSLVPVNQFIKQNPNGYIAHCSKANKVDLNKIETSRPIIIGPEGDFTWDEINCASELGYTPISLGNHRLRTETAALYAVCKMSLL